jgi:hypothetical protein
MSLFACAALGGCNNETDLGGPGAVDPVPGPIEAEPAESRTFQLALPSGEVDLSRGEEQQLTVSVDRGDDFHQAVAIEFMATAQGVTVTPAQATVAAEEEKLQVVVAAGPDAPVGETSITVLGKPESGEAVSGAIKLQIDEVR